MLTQIVEAVERRTLPDSVEQVKAWLKELSGESKRMLPAVSCLLAAARRANKGKEDASFNAWAKAELGYNRCYVSHCAKIGDMLIDAREGAYRKLAALSFDKLLAISRLDLAEAEIYAESKELGALSRDEVRSDISRLLGESAKEKAPKPAQLGCTLRDMVHEAATMTSSAMGIMAETSTPEQVVEMIAAGQSLLMTGTQALIDRKLGSPEGFATLESYLEAQLQTVKSAREALEKEGTASSVNSIPAALTEAAP